MTNLKEVQGKYLVLKVEDCETYLWDEQVEQLNGILEEINECKYHNLEATDNKYLVINQDEPYAEEVIEIMKRHGHWE